MSSNAKEVPMSVANKDWGSEGSFGRQRFEQVAGEREGERAAYKREKRIKWERELETLGLCNLGQNGI